MQVEVDEKCMLTKFGGHGFFLEILLLFEISQISLLDCGLYSPWGSKIELTQKIHASRG